jgi:hypothetical protein
MKILLLFILACVLSPIMANDFDVRIRESILKGLNPNKDPKLFLNEDLYTNNSSKIKSSSFYEHIAFHQKPFHENIFYIKYPDVESFNEYSIKRFSNGMKFYNIKDIRNLNCIPYKSSNNKKYFIGSFTLVKFSKAKLYYVLGENANLLYIGIVNKYSDLVSATLPIYSFDSLIDESFREFDIDVLKYTNDNKDYILLP